jgi:chromosome segregation ATPase
MVLPVNTFRARSASESNVPKPDFEALLPAPAAAPEAFRGRIPVDDPRLMLGERGSTDATGENQKTSFNDEDWINLEKQSIEAITTLKNEIEVLRGKLENEEKSRKILGEIKQNAIDKLQRELEEAEVAQTQVTTSVDSTAATIRSQLETLIVTKADTDKTRAVTIENLQEKIKSLEEEAQTDQDKIDHMKKARSQKIEQSRENAMDRDNDILEQTMRADELRDQKKGYRQNVREWKAYGTDIKDYADKKSGELAGREQYWQGVSDRNDTLSDQINRQKEEISQLKAELADLQPAKTESTNNKKYRENLDAKQREIQGLRDQQKNEQQEILAIFAAEKEFNPKPGSLSAALDKMRKRHVAEYNKLQKDFAKATAKLIEVDKDRKTVEQERNDAVAERDAIAKELKDTNRDYNKLLDLYKNDKDGKGTQPASWQAVMAGAAVPAVAWAATKLLQRS